MLFVAPRSSDNKKHYLTQRSERTLFCLFGLSPGFQIYCFLSLSCIPSLRVLLFFISDHSISCVSVSSSIASSLACLRQLDVCHRQWYKQKLSNKEKSIDAVAHKLTISQFLMRILYDVKYILLF